MTAERGARQIAAVMRAILPDNLAAVFIASFPAGPWQTNCFVLGTGVGAECMIIDPGLGAAGAVADVVAENRLKPVAVVVTHGHLDHTFSVTPLCAGYDATCWIHPDDRAYLADPYAVMGPEARDQVRQLTGRDEVFTEPDDVRVLTDGQQVSIAGVDLTAIHAPGHTPGSVMYRTPYADDDAIDSLLFSGDVLFAGSIGRTDLPGGDHAAMLTSLATKVLPLPDEVVVLPGHGPQTTVAAERAGNPYLQRDQLR